MSMGRVTICASYFGYFIIKPHGTFMSLVFLKTRSLQAEEDHLKSIECAESLRYAENVNPPTTSVRSMFMAPMDSSGPPVATVSEAMHCL